MLTSPQGQGKKVRLTFIPPSEAARVTVLSATLPCQCLSQVPDTSRVKVKLLTVCDEALFDPTEAYGVTPSFPPNLADNYDTP